VRHIDLDPSSAGVVFYGLYDLDGLNTRLKDMKVIKTTEVITPSEV